MGKTFVENNNQHDAIVKEAARSLKGQIFTRAPFDLVLEDGRFVEVKTSVSKRHLWRIRVSDDEYRFGQLKDLWVLFMNNQGTFLFPTNQIMNRLKEKSTRTWSGFKSKEIGVGKIAKNYPMKI